MIKKIDSHQWRLAVQGSYSGISLTLFKANNSVESIDVQDKRASSFLIPYIDALLKNNHLKLNDLSSIAVDKGPGAFTSLRTTIATINGIAFACDVPLIGVNGLDALACEVHEYQNTHGSFPPQTMIMLNAYSNDCYYLLYTIDHQNRLQIEYTGCLSIDELLRQLQNHSPNTTTMFAGNAAILHQQLIQTTLGHYALFSKEYPSIASSHMIGICAYQQQQHAIKQVIPNYMKIQKFTMKK